MEYSEHTSNNGIFRIKYETSTGQYDKCCECVCNSKFEEKPCGYVYVCILASETYNGNRFDDNDNTNITRNNSTFQSTFYGQFENIGTTKEQIVERL